MKQLIKCLCFIIILVMVLTSIGFGSDSSPKSIIKAYKDLSKDNGNYCYIVGKFPLTHTSDRSIANDDIAEHGVDINKDTLFTTKIGMINTDNNATYELTLKPVSGSDTAYYSEKKLIENTNDPYLILKVPIGTYKLTNLMCKFSAYAPNYSTSGAQILDIPVSKMINKTINFSIKPKQIVYIGDYSTMLATYICIYQQTKLYAFRDIKIEFNNNFDTVKADFLNGADDKLKEKLNEYEFVSIQ